MERMLLQQGMDVSSPSAEENHMNTAMLASPRLERLTMTPVSDATTTVNHETLSALINMAGRQRMLSQRLVLHAVLAVQGQTQSAQMALDTLALMSRSHQQLVKGGDGLPGLFSPALHALYFAPRHADADINRFMALAQTVLQGLRHPTPAHQEALSQLIEMSTPLLGLLNELTQAYEVEAREQAKRERQQRHKLIEEIKDIAREAKIVAFNALVAANRAGPQGKEFAVVAGRMSTITEEVDRLARQALAAQTG
jgi:hypothetical protein